MNLQRLRNNAPEPLRLRRRTSEGDLEALRHSISRIHGPRRSARKAELVARGLIRTPFEQRGFALDLAIRKDKLEHCYSLRPSPRKLVQEGLLRETDVEVGASAQPKISVSVRAARRGHVRHDTPAVGDLVFGAEGASAIFRARASASAKERLMELRSKVWKEEGALARLEIGLRLTQRPTPATRHPTPDTRHPQGIVRTTFDIRRRELRRSLSGDAVECLLKRRTASALLELPTELLAAIFAFLSPHTLLGQLPRVHRSFARLPADMDDLVLIEEGGGCGGGGGGAGVGSGGGGREGGGRGADDKTITISSSIRTAARRARRRHPHWAFLANNAKVSRSSRPAELAALAVADSQAAGGVTVACEVPTKWKAHFRT